MSLLELKGVLAMCNKRDGHIIDIYVMSDYEAEDWTLTHQINLPAMAP
jgi:hypothetical protein